MGLKLTNNATGLLAANINSSVTSISLASSAGSKFPTLTVGDWCPIVVVDGSGNLEIMRCTARSGDVLTVTRGQEGTTARSFSSGARVDVRLTSAALAEFALSSDMTDALDLKADLASPEFTGTPRAPKAADNDYSTQIATTEWVQDFVPIPIGAVLEYHGATLPPRFLWANGSAVSRVTYALLFAALGSPSSSGNGSTTFNVPDRRGRVGVGKDNMGGVTAAGRVTTAGSGIDGATLGATGGAQNVTLDTPQIPAHKHNVAALQDPHYHLVALSQGVLVQTNGTARAAHGDPIATSTVQPAITVFEDTVGGWEAHNNMPPSIVCNFIVYAGV